MEDERMMQPETAVPVQEREAAVLSEAETCGELQVTKGCDVGALHPLNAEEIRQILPHRYPFLLIDQVTDYVPGQFAAARKCVTINEPFFQGHFPDYPVMPGVLLLEALAQTGAVALLSMPAHRGKLAIFGGIRNARFRKQVRPGDVLELRCELTRLHGTVGIGRARATVDGQLAVQAELTFAVQ